MDGKVVIGMDLDTKELEKKLKDSQKLLEKYEKEQEKLTEQRQQVDIETEEAQKKIENLQKHIDALIQRRDALLSKGARPTSPSVVFTERDIQTYQEQMDAMLGGIDNKYKEIDRAIEQNAINQQLVTKEIEKTQNELKQAQRIDSLNAGLKSVGKTIEKNIKLVAKWAIGFIGLRTGVNMLRSAYSEIAKYDKQLASDVDYLRYALANSLKPIIEWIINAFYQLLALFGYIVKQITGKNIFAKSGAGQFKKDLDGASKSAKELNKQLAGFDEANVLTDNKSASGGGTKMPSKDLAKMVEDFKPEEMFDAIDKGIDKARIKLLEYQDELGTILSNRKAFTDAFGVWDWFVHGIGMIWKGIVDIFSGVWDTLVALWDMFMDIITGNTEKLGEDFKKFVSGIAEIIGGLGEFIVGKIEITWGFVKGLLSTIFGWVYDHLVKPIGNAIGGLCKNIGDVFIGTWNAIKNTWNGATSVFSGIANNISSVFTRAVNNIKNVFSGLWNSIKSGFSGVANYFGGIASTLKNGAKSVINFFIDGINKFINGMNKISWDVPDWVPAIGGKKWGINIPKIPRLASGGIVNMPSSGVMVGGAIAGENGREGVIPLTDPNAMAQLGKEIGQWINIGIDNKMVVDGRVLATATQNRLNKESFLMNR